MEIAAKLTDYRLSGIEAHYPNEINEDNAEIWKQFEKDTGIKLITIVPLLFWEKEFEWGSLSNPLPDRRKEAIELTKRTLQMYREMKTHFAVVWPGIDGYENPLGTGNCN